jgi:hypothetical protein
MSENPSLGKSAHVFSKKFNMKTKLNASEGLQINFCTPALAAGGPNFTSRKRRVGAAQLLKERSENFKKYS